MSVQFGGAAYGGGGGGFPGEEDDLYEGYGSAPVANPSVINPNAGMQQFQQQHGTFNRPPPTSHRQVGPPTRMGTAMRSSMGSEEARPMTSVKAAGYSSTQASQRGALDTSAGQRPAPALVPKELTAEDHARELERKVNTLIEESATANSKGQFQLALEKAKEAGKRERALQKEREKTNNQDAINLDLTYSVCFNLANQYQANGMYTEALNSYSLIVRDKKYAQSGRLRVNMGNIYYEQKKYTNAIKMYRMALDQIPNTGKEVRFKIMRNIGNAFVRMGQFQDAIQSFEAIMDGNPDHQTGFNLILCYYALGDKDKMKKGFSNLLAIHIPGNDSDEEDNGLEDAPAKSDQLLAEIRQRQSVAHRFMLLAGKLIAPTIERDWEAGYDYVIEQLKMTYPSVASEMEIARAITYLKKKDFDNAVSLLKSFEKKEPAMMSKAATNLSFVYFYEGDYKKGEKYAQTALSLDRYNAKALVNLANIHFTQGEYQQAQELYTEAIGIEADCVEAFYNLGLCHKKLGNHRQALQIFEKLDAIIPNCTDVIYQLGNIHDMWADQEKIPTYNKALNYFNMLHQRCATDAGVLARLGNIFSKEDDESQAHQNFKESYDVYPVNMDVISWLGAYYVKNEVYEKAIQFFERAAEIQPKEVKWQLMVASCHRRVGSYQQALQIYENIHREYPDNVECLRYLVHICTDLGMKDKVHEYVKHLRVAERQSGTTKAANPQTLAGGGQYDDDNGYGGNSGGGMPTQEYYASGQDAGYSNSPKGGYGQTPSPSTNKKSKTPAGRSEHDDDWGDEELGDDLLPM